MFPQIVHTSNRQFRWQYLLVIAMTFGMAAIGLIFLSKGSSSIISSESAIDFSKRNPADTLPDTLQTEFQDPILEPFHPMKRYSLRYDKVACWQDGGVWIAKLYAVELSSLGIDRFQDTERSQNQEEEDAFCARLKTYGAGFWSLPPRWPGQTVWCETIDCVEPDIERAFAVGWPSTGGKWILDVSQGWEQYWPQSFALSNALSMDERCNVIEKLGGKFYEDAEAPVEIVATISASAKNTDEPPFL